MGPCGYCLKGWLGRVCVGTREREGGGERDRERENAAKESYSPSINSKYIYPKMPIIVSASTSLEVALFFMDR